MSSPAEAAYPDGAELAKAVAVRHRRGTIFKFAIPGRS